MLLSFGIWLIGCLLLKMEQSEENCDFNVENEKAGGQHLAVENRGTKNNLDNNLGLAFHSAPSYRRPLIFLLFQ